MSANLICVFSRRSRFHFLMLTNFPQSKRTSVLTCLDAVPVSVNYLNLTGAQRLAAAFAEFGSNGTSNEAEAQVRLIGGLVLALQFASGPELNDAIQALLANQVEAGLLTQGQYDILASIDYATLRTVGTATGVIPLAAASLLLGSGIEGFRRVTDCSDC